MTELLPQDYPPPADREAEQLLLAALLRDEIPAAPQELKRSCFTDAIHVWLWDHRDELLRLDGWDSRVRWIADRRPADWQQAADLFWLPVPVGEEVEEWTASLTEHAKRRALLERCQQVTALLRTGAVSSAGAWSLIRGVETWTV